VGTGLFLCALARLEPVSTGFKPDGVLAAMLTLPEARYNSREKQAPFLDGVTKRLAGVPGAMRAAAVVPLPFSGSEASGSFSILGRATHAGDPAGNISGVTIFGSWPALLRRRWFTDRNRLGAEPVTVIDTNLTRQYWSNERSDRAEHSDAGKT